MRNFKIYLPGGREPTIAGLSIIVAGIFAMGACIGHMDRIAALMPQLTIAQAEGLLIAFALLVIATGWAILKIFRIPFSRPCRKEEFGFTEENEK